jgi:hypothetical protein
MGSFGNHRKAVRAGEAFLSVQADFAGFFACWCFEKLFLRKSMATRPAKKMESRAESAYDVRRLPTTEDPT